MKTLSRKRGSQWFTLWLLVVTAFLVLPALPAGAATITYKILFAAENIAGPSAPPVHSAGGLFTLTFDPSHDYEFPADYVGSSITTDFLTVPVDSTVGFFYDHALDRLIIGGLSDTPSLLTTSQHDFALLIQTLTTSPTFDVFGISNAVAGQIWTTHDGIVVTQVVPTIVAATPIPASLPLLVFALGGLGIVGWRRQQRRAVA